MLVHIIFSNVFSFIGNNFGISENLCTFADMRVIAYSAIREFIKHHADAEKPLRDWYTKVCRASWTTLADIKKDFNSADYV